MIMGRLVLIVALLLLAGSGALGAQEDPRDRALTLHLRQVAVRVALKRIFGAVRIGYTVARDVQGNVTLVGDSASFEAALRCALDQVDATWRCFGGIYEIIKRDIRIPTASLAARVQLPDLHPGQCSASYRVRNKALYLTDDLTLKGTYDLLVNAASQAGYSEPSLYRYGPDGFALALPLEAIGEDGRPPSENVGVLPDLGAGLDFRKIADVVQGSSLNANYAYRMLVLVVSMAPIRPDGIAGEPWWLYPREKIPSFFSTHTWQTDPTLTVLVYEFRHKPGSDALALRGRRERGLSGRDHVVSAGLWKVSEL
jgi:hypothetical protein